MSKKACDCTSWCGDDSNLLDDTVEPCEGLKKRLIEKERLSQKITSSHIAEVAQILRNIANELESCGTGEWSTLGDCTKATQNNLYVDLAIVGTGR